MAAQGRFHVVHVAGTRMIEQGTDGLSRGDHNAGVMQGDEMLNHIPLHVSALCQSDRLRDWVGSWITPSSESLRSGWTEPHWLDPKDWPRAHESKGTYVWTPPPAAPPSAVDWLGESIHKRPYSIHVVLVPRLMSMHWRKQLGKTGDVEIVIPVVGAPLVTNH